jgi:hypothetical protein
MAHVCSWSLDASSELNKLSQQSESCLSWARKVRDELAFQTAYPGGIKVHFRDGLFEAIGADQVFLRLDFLNDRRNYLRKNSQGKKDLFLRALGFDHAGQRVVDLTCGLGRDTTYLAQQGMQVWSFERDPLLAFLFQSSLVLQKPPSTEKINFCWADTMSCNFEFPPAETAYFDPMYPVSRKMKAKPRKEIEFVRHHLGSPVDLKPEEEFVARILEKKIFQRLTVKVHPHGQFDPGVAPHHVFKGESVVYHSYISRS